MTLKRLLIFIPLLLIAVLLQSYFWVPTYKNQTTGNPQRLRKYIEGSTADAQILNPILNADTASSNITGYVFEGLLDLDENLNLRGRLATDWHITENAYLLVNPQKRLPDGTPATGPELVQRITRALESGKLPELTGVLLSVRLLPPESWTQTLTLAEKDSQGRPASAKITVTVEVPERLAFSLSRVDQDFFPRLQPILGEQYLGTSLMNNTCGWPIQWRLSACVRGSRRFCRPRNTTRSFCSISAVACVSTTGTNSPRKMSSSPTKPS